MIEDALAPDQLRPLQRQFAQWARDSRAHDAPYGETLDQRPRFDLQPEHAAERTALRRIASPIEISDEISDDYLRAMRENHALDAIMPSSTCSDPTSSSTIARSTPNCRAPRPR